jgi:predicted nucleic acid-binding protein
VSIAYLDSSALVKHYIAEVGSDWVKSLLALDRTPTVFTSNMTVVEAACAFARRRREGTLSPQDHDQVLTAFDYDIAYRYNIVDVDPMVVEIARQLANRHPLRAYDAVQLATAWLANRELIQAGQSPLTFICADDPLIAIAQVEGLLTDNPNHHP